MTNGKKTKAPQPLAETFEEAAKRIQEEGEAIPFDEVLRRLVKAPPTPQDKRKKSGTRRQVRRTRD